MTPAEVTAIRDAIFEARVFVSEIGLEYFRAKQYEPPELKEIRKLLDQIDERVGR